MDTDDTGLLLRLPEEILYQVNDPKLTLMCFAGDTLLWQAGLSGAEPRLSVATNSLGGGIYVVDADVTLEGTTISGHDDVENGGGIYAVQSAGAVSLTMDITKQARTELRRMSEHASGVSFQR